ncbi:hydroxyacylglutathione hydrolase [Pedobacter sp. CG_S7]|uniref:MBL fold metallo-hydrolase n=1 Tax=Pedobacter sp. CG_S7 TaxID=3143930 RepID=UPI00339795B8
MKIEQFEDKSLSHYSYAVLSERQNEVVLIDPSRDLSPYIAYAASNKAKIIGVIETHPHADFVSGHLELHETTGATIYCSKLIGAEYPHHTFDDGQQLNFGEIMLKAVNTPGHSPDGISIVLEQEGKDYAVFTGDTLFIGDCGRPDLRESAGNITSKREDLAKQMYHSLREKLMNLDDEVLLYPAHGAGTLCGKGLSEANSSTMGAEKISNWSLQQMTESQFITKLLADQPFIPAYFTFDVELNRKGAMALNLALEKVKRTNWDSTIIDSQVVIVDARSAAAFKTSHLKGAINIMADGKFETWLGSIIKPSEPFYLVAENNKALNDLLLRTAKIGYESFIKEAFVLIAGDTSSDQTAIIDFKENPSAYTIVDVRNRSEVTENAGFEHALHIPLPELRSRIAEIPSNKPIMVHCAGGYRSAAASSIIEGEFSAQTKVYDLSTAVKDFF